MTEKRFAFVIDNGEYTFYDLSENGEIMNMIDTEDMLNELNDENEQLKDEVYEEMDNALTVLRDLYEDTPVKSQKKMNNLYNRLESLRDEMK